MIDLHTHTVASDGTLSLEELIIQAEAAGLSAIAITDHDTVASAAQIKNVKSSIEMIPGIEFSVYDNRLNYIDLHVLGLFIDPQNPKLISTLKALDKERDNQKRTIIGALNELGYSITYEDAKKFASGTLGRPHIARALMEKYPDEFHSIGECFDKLLEQGKPAFISRSAFFCLDDCINIIHESGGLAFLAHPGFYKYDTDKLLNHFKKLGGDGIETIYDYAANSVFRGFDETDDAKLRVQFQQVAKEMGFLESGGSDYHGPNKGSKLGKLDVPDGFLNSMKNKIKGSI
jgi:predicted metal-dependent phosphoesterase TrpH